MVFFTRITLFAFFVLAFGSVSTSYALEQSGLMQEEKELTMAIIKHERKKVVARNISLAEGEKKAFWKSYDLYQKDMEEIGSRKLALIEEYAKAYKNNSLTDTQALKLLNGHFLNQQILCVHNLHVCQSR